MAVPIPQAMAALYGERAPDIVAEYQTAFRGRHLVVTDLAVFCGAAAPIEGANEFERGVAEGRRRVWLHIAEVLGLSPLDFRPYMTGDKIA